MSDISTPSEGSAQLKTRLREQASAIRKARAERDEAHRRERQRVAEAVRDFEIAQAKANGTYWFGRAREPRFMERVEKTVTRLAADDPHFDPHKAEDLTKRALANRDWRAHHKPARLKAEAEARAQAFRELKPRFVEEQRALRQWVSSSNAPREAKAIVKHMPAVLLARRFQLVADRVGGRSSMVAQLQAVFDRDPSKFKGARRPTKRSVAILMSKVRCVVESQTWSS